MYKNIKKIVTIISLFFYLNPNLNSEPIINPATFARLLDKQVESWQDVFNLFPSNPQDIIARTPMTINILDQDLTTYLNIPKEERTFQNTAKAYDSITSKYYIATASLYLVSILNPDQNVVNACYEQSAELISYADANIYTKDVYNAFKDYYELNAQTEVLTQEETNYLTTMMQYFYDSGYEFEDLDFQYVKDINNYLSSLAAWYDDNVFTDNSSITVSRQELEGMSDAFIYSLPRNSSGDYILYCNKIVYDNILSSCDIRSTRKSIYYKFNNVAYADISPNNIDILNEIIFWSDVLALFLGYNSYAEYEISKTMAGSPENVTLFLENLTSKTSIKYKEEYNMLRKKLPLGVTLSPDGKFYDYDYQYIKAKYKKNYYGVDEDLISQHFEINSTLRRIFDLCEMFYNVKIKIVPEKNYFDKSRTLWARNLYTAEIYNKANNQLICYLILDLFPRNNKYSYAATGEFVSSTIISSPNAYKDEAESLGISKTKYDNCNRSVILLITNVERIFNVKQHLKYLLSFDSVSTIMHELGHVFQIMLGQTELNQFAAANTTIDFSEVPSQMNQEWLWNKKILKFLTKHYKTGQSLSDEMIDKKIATKSLDSGYQSQYLLFKSFISLDYYAPGDTKDLDLIKQTLFNQYLPYIEYEPDNHFDAAFLHLSSYGPSYYSYLWSKVIDLDFFYYIKKYGLTNKKIGQKYRNVILNPAGSISPATLCYNFLGRNPNEGAFDADLFLPNIIKQKGVKKS